MGSLPALAVAKPLAALCARPSPNLFARKAWAASSLNDNDPADEDSSMEESSDLTDLTELEQQPAPTAVPDPAPTAVPDPTPTAVPSPAPISTPIPVLDQSGQKRKRDSVTAERKKLGKTFFMKDEKRPMPKGWVLVTDSSEETGEDEDERAEAEAPKSVEPPSNITKQASHMITVDQAADSPVSGLDSVSGSTPSLVHTPSSRATSTPTQSSGTLVDDQATTPVAAKRVLITYSLRRNATGRTPSTALSPKRRKLSEEGDTTPSRGKSRNASVNPITQTSSESNRSHDQEVKTSVKPNMSLRDSPREPSAPSAGTGSARDPKTGRYISTEFEVSLVRSLLFQSSNKTC